MCVSECVQALLRPEKAMNALQLELNVSVDPLEKQPSELLSHPSSSIFNIFDILSAGFQYKPWAWIHDNVS